MRARWIGVDIDSYKQLTQPGDIGIGAENYHHHVIVSCPVCGELHIVDERWQLDRVTMTLNAPGARSYMLWKHTGEICHWTLTNGEFEIHPDSRKDS